MEVLNEYGAVKYFGVNTLQVEYLDLGIQWKTLIRHLFWLFAFLLLFRFSFYLRDIQLQNIDITTNQMIKYLATIQQINFQE
ncbi:MAG: hypothetical protein CM15mP102_02430 [Flavobacteriales bacterium]|nr:MAG: hypothetical protein CM15mP102_02430 [Flavobacteriales bacterium]